MFDRLGAIISRHWIAVILFWIFLCVVLQYAAPPWDSVANDGDLVYLPNRMTSVRGEQRLQTFFPGPPPHIQESDIHDWLGFSRAIAKQKAQSELTPGKYLAEQLPSATQELLQHGATEGLPQVEDRETIVEGINRLLHEQDFAVSPAFKGVTAAVSQTMLPGNQLSEDELARRNRELFDLAFADFVSFGPRGNSRSQLVLVFERADGPLTDEDKVAIDEFSAQFAPELAGKLPIVAQWNRHTELVNEKLVSADGRAILTIIGLSTEFMAVRNKDVLKSVHEVAEKTKFPEGLSLGISGSAAIGGDMIASAAESIKNTENATVALVLIILLLVYRAPTLVIIPLTTIIVSVVVALRLVAILVDQHVPLIPIIGNGQGGLHFIGLEVFSTSKVFIITILFGAGTDFCMFLVSRYREELEAGKSRFLAVHHSLANVGVALAASAFTTICGLGVMLFADFGKYKHSGPTIGICLLVALAACMTLAPALLLACGRWVFWPFRPPGPKSDEKPKTKLAAWIDDSALNQIWEINSRFILKYPKQILFGGLLLICVFAIPGMSTQVTHDLLSELPEQSISKTGTRMLRKHYAPGDTGPMTILVYHRPGNLDTAEGREQISQLTKMLASIKEEQEVQGQVMEVGVQDVRSLAYPLGNVPEPGQRLSFREVADLKAAQRHPQTRERYLSNVEGMEGAMTRLEVILSSDPFSQESLDWLEKIDQRLQAELHNPESPWFRGDQQQPSTEFDLVGVTAGIRDLKAVTSSDLRLIQPLVICAVLAVLLLLLREIAVSVFVMVTVLLGYLVTMGITEWLFSLMYADSFHGLDWKVPLFLFVILVAVGMDYNIYLISRVAEERKRVGGREGIRLAIVQTGGIITSCGLIMAGTFISMMTGTLRGMMELGFALSFGVLLDTLFIRTILVPSFLVLLHAKADSPTAPDSPSDDSREKQKSSHTPSTPLHNQLHTTRPHP